MRIEWLLFLSLLAIGLFPFLRRASSVGAKFVVLILLLAGCGLFAANKWSDWRIRKASERSHFYASVPHEGRPGGYVSSDKCQSCHPDQYSSWHRSYHRTMTQYATPEAVRGKFEGQTLELEGQSYKFERRGDEFWVEMLDPDWRLEYLANPGKPPSTPATRVWKRLGITTGSHHMQAYWVPSAKGNLQLNLPFSYLFEDERWVPRNDTFLMDPHFPAPVQLWNANCIQCHATAGQPRPDPKDYSILRTQLGEIGIACEACHGPAEKHVALNANPARRLAMHRVGKDPTITNPSHLSHVKSSQVCGQCHSIKTIPREANWKDEGFKYRPGDDLEKFTPVTRATKTPKEHDAKFLEERYWSDGMVRVSGREFNGLIESPCFQKGTMSCLSCHSLHESAPDDQLAKGMESNAACTQCHQDLSPNHSHHTQTSSGSLCYNCHMPHTTYGLMKAIRSHQVDSPSVQATIATGRPNACNLCHLDKTLAWTAEKLTEW
ncbi:MAG TPA: cytochrome c3 family protein, partial [Verrucomicrobiae bacterium]|nr:cytochrome c3 family protein [Verrucomicrobiae bacterium]